MFAKLCAVIKLQLLATFCNSADGIVKLFLPLLFNELRFGGSAQGRDGGVCFALFDHCAAGTELVLVHARVTRMLGCR